MKPCSQERHLTNCHPAAPRMERRFVKVFLQQRNTVMFFPTGSITTTASHCFIFFFVSWEPGGEQLADGRLGSPIIPIQPHWLVSCGEDRRKLWAGASLSQPCQDYKYDACSVSLCIPFMVRALIIKTHNLHNITVHKIAPLYYVVYWLLRLQLLVLLKIILIIYVFLLAALPCFLSLSFHIGHDPREKNSCSSQKGEIFWVSASVPADDKDYFRDLLLPLWWLMLQLAFMSQQKKKKMQNGTSTCIPLRNVHV